jgi:xanthine dehydrogenase accessory factor
VVTYGVSKDEAARFGLPCGGTVRIVVEPQPDLVLLQALLQRILLKRLTVRELNLVSGKSVLCDASCADIVSFDGQVMRTVYGPRWRLVVVGAGQLSQYVCQFALAADYEVVVVDPREEFTEGLTMAGVDFRRGMPDDVILALGIDNHTAVLALTHDPKLDDMALLEALKSSAFYVGALGSRTSTAKRRERLALFDLSAEEVDRLHGPVGLYIGADTPPEMALSILAEVTAAKHRVPILQKRQIDFAELSKRHKNIEMQLIPTHR